METPEKPQGLIDPTNQRPTNPARKFCSWKSDSEAFVYYDKEKKENVVLPMPFTFIPLAKAVCIKGYNEPEKMSIISNEIKDQSKDVFIVRGFAKGQKPRVLCKGLWANISKEVGGYDGKWTESIYAAGKDANGNLELINVQLSGAGMTHWFEFLKSNKIFGSAVSVKDWSEEKKGKVKYTAPKFSLVKIAEKTNLQAADLQKQILAYLDEYYKSNESEQGEVAETTPEPAKTTNSAAPKSSTPATSGSDIHFNPDEDSDPPF